MAVSSSAQRAPSAVPVEQLSAPTGAAIRPLLLALRPRQWTKNLLLFAGILFAVKLDDASRWVEVWVAFIAYCAASSAAYLVNDVRDAPQDRAHPTKRTRPIARGAVSAATALIVAAVLAALAIGLTAALGLWSVAILGAFFALQVAYSFGLKHVVLIDVMAIAGLFVVRAVAGAVAVDVPISPWLFVCTALLALFLALGKRRGELLLVESRATAGRRVLEGYSVALLDQLITVVAASTVIAYSLYTFTAHDTNALMATIPFVLFGIFRYLLLVHRDQLGEEPDHVLLSDKPLIVNLCLWAVTAVAILAIA